MEELKEIAVIVVSTWAAVEVLKQFIRAWENYYTDWYRREYSNLTDVIAQMTKSELPKKGKK